MIDDCGAGDGVDCAEVLAAVWTYLDNETDESQREHLRAHLDQCTACLRHYGLEHEVKALVARCCGSDRAPEELRTRVLSLVRTTLVLPEAVVTRTTTVETTTVEVTTRGS